jgi:hypothetical protein
VQMLALLHDLIPDCVTVGRCSTAHPCLTRSALRVGRTAALNARAGDARNIRESRAQNGPWRSARGCCTVNHVRLDPESSNLVGTGKRQRYGGAANGGVDSCSVANRLVLCDHLCGPACIQRRVCAPPGGWRRVIQMAPHVVTFASGAGSGRRRQVERQRHKRHRDWGCMQAWRSLGVFPAGAAIHARQVGAPSRRNGSDTEG